MAGPCAVRIPRGHRLRPLRILVVLAACAVFPACHEEGDIQVKSLSITGNDAFKSSVITNVLATRQSGWLPWSPRHYFDRAEFDADLERIKAFYADHGYPHARVADVDVTFNATRTAVDLTMRIEEGAPTVVESVTFVGFDVLDATVRAPLDAPPLAVGKPRDRDAVRATRDLSSRLLRDNGYALAAVTVRETPTTDADHVAMSFQAEPGAKMSFGEVRVVGLESVGENVVRRELAFRPGDLYRERAILRTQRRLGRLALFELANVTPRLEEVANDQVPVRVTIAEGKPRRLRLGVGYGSEEKARGTVEWKHLNFTGGAREADVDAKWSSIDRGLRLSFTEPYVRRPGLSATVSAMAWRTSELTYDSQTYGGRARLTYRTDRGLGAQRPAARYTFGVGYANEYLRYGITAASLDDLSRREERIALGLDPDTGRAVGTLATVSADVERLAVDAPVAPTRGTHLTLHLERAAPWLAGTYDFAEVLGEARVYVPVVSSVVFAARARYGTLVAADPLTVPFAKRYFLGGSTSLRGWGRYQVSPLSADGLPVGGRTLFEASGEIRFPIRNKLSGVLFADAGNVWADGWETDLRDLRWDVGPGIRYDTPIGSIRVDLGVQLTSTRIDGLLINGAPELRHYRLHFSIGQAF
jgi:outer membrane protein assembly complex protein YaeT